MTRKTIKFNGFGFPVILVNVPMKIEYDDEIPDINFNLIQKQLFHALLHKPTRLSGAEVKFLRHHLALTQDQFSKILKVERSLISKWEGRVLKASGMSTHVEIFLRLKLTRLDNRSIDFAVIEPATATKSVGKPVELKAS